MSRGPAELAALVAELLVIAREAGGLVRRGWRAHPAVTLKGRTDLVTEFDLASEALVRERVAARLGLPLVGEEGGGEAGPGLAVHCDPIDGTTNFAHGHPFWCVSLGLIEGGAALGGAVAAPALATEWHGDVLNGACRDGQRVAVSATAEARDALVATGFPQDRATAPGNNFASFVAVKQAVRGVRRCGSAALDLCLVADGTYDAYWERRLHSWDVAAGAALVLAAGGRLTALDGGPPDLDRGNLLASNGQVHAALLELIAAGS